MGKEKYMRRVENLFEKSPVVSSRSIAMIVKSRQYAKQVVRNLILRKKIHKLAKGFYTSKDEAALAVFCFKPAYLGLQDALSFHNLWEQETIPVIITAKKIRQGIRKILGVNVMIRRMEKKYMFGFDYSDDGFYLPYSDIEKTFIDMLYFRLQIEPEAKANLLKKININKLNSYLKAYPERFRKKILKTLLLQRKQR